ncbi:hypothetical protein HAX54_029585 [Datura stramonium]|uniref:Uncharacterized protein n=1 Tax=Datura stramonium TaxID=4076 RepID=A0ABS8V6I3_DATST|nr:hypothetical protein [Datura stramonium]
MSWREWAKASTSGFKRIGETSSPCQGHAVKKQAAITLRCMEGWCDSIGSVEQIQEKLLKRQEAAAKREKTWPML